MQDARRIPLDLKGWLHNRQERDGTVLTMRVCRRLRPLLRKEGTMDKRPSQGNADTSSVVSGDVEVPSLPLLNLAREAEAAMLAGSTEQPSPCESVTSQAIEDAINRARNARRKADENNAKNGASETGGAAMAAARHAALAQESLENVLRFLNKNGMFGQSGVVTSPAGTGATTEAARVAVTNLLLERHFAAVSAISARQDNRDPNSALECISLVEEAVSPTETLSTQALHCYLRAVFPDA
jgi:hypothetical protein